MSRVTEKAASQLAEEVLTISPESVAARSFLVRAAVSDGNFYDAEARTKEVLKDFPGAAWAHRLAAGVHLAKKELAAARLEYDRALKIDPTDLNALRGRVATDIQDKNLNASRTLLGDRLRGAPTNRALLLLAAGIEEAAGDTAALEKLLRRVIDVDSTNSEAFASLARLYAKQNKLDQAKAEYQALAKRLPKSTAALMMVLGWICYKKDLATPLPSVRSRQASRATRRMPSIDIISDWRTQKRATRTKPGMPSPKP